MKLLFAVAVALLVEVAMASPKIELSIGPGVEAVAVSATAVDIYLPANHGGATILRDGVQIATAAPGERSVRDEGLAPDRLYSYTVVTGVESVAVAEKTFPAISDVAAYDIVIVGATASGTAAAVTAARRGASVALIEETNRAGGMAANGLGVTDMRNISRSNGVFDEFRRRVVTYYGRGDGMRYEPRVANAVMKSMIYAEPNITFLRRTRATGVLKEGGRVAGVEVVDLDTGTFGQLRARMTIDSTVEADVAAAAGVKFRIPREARSPEEPHAGHIYYDNSTNEILPGSTGEADEKIQSYAYLLTVKEYGVGEDRTISAPPNYNPEDYRHSPPWEESWGFLYGRLPNGKFELNQHPWGGDLPGVNYSWPDASPEERAEIAQLHRWRALGYLYYLQTELGKRNLGLADDEYPENGNFPPALYVREARRMHGRTSMNEADVTFARDRYVPTSVAIGDYPMDSHATEELRDPTARHRGEGEWWLVNFTPWYRVPLGVILPEDAPGLIVPTAVSATHVAYGTLRMEPVRMSLGQAAGMLAALSIRYGVFPDEFPAAIVQDRLLTQKVYLTWFEDVNRRTRHFRAIQFLSVRGFFSGETFRPDDPLAVDEAEWLMGRLVRVETQGFDAADPEMVRDLQSRTPLPGFVTRAQFAELLVKAKTQVDSDWTPDSLLVSHYADLQPGTPASAYAETLYRHRIDTRTWAGPPSRSEAGLLFHPDATITRADAAQAIFLAHRAVAMRFATAHPR